MWKRFFIMGETNLVMVDIYIKIIVMKVRIMLMYLLGEFWYLRCSFVVFVGVVLVSRCEFGRILRFFVGKRKSED